MDLRSRGQLRLLIRSLDRYQSGKTEFLDYHELPEVNGKWNSIHTN